MGENNKLPRVTLYETSDAGGTHYRVLNYYSRDRRWMAYIEVLPGCYRVNEGDYHYKQIQDEYVIPEDDALLLDGVNCTIDLYDSKSLHDGAHTGREKWNLPRRHKPVPCKTIMVKIGDNEEYTVTTSDIDGLRNKLCDFMKSHTANNYDNITQLTISCCQWYYVDGREYKTRAGAMCYLNKKNDDDPARMELNEESNGLYGWLESMHNRQFQAFDFEPCGDETTKLVRLIRYIGVDKTFSIIERNIESPESIRIVRWWRDYRFYESKKGYDDDQC